MCCYSIIRVLLFKQYKNTLHWKLYISSIYPRGPPYLQIADNPSASNWHQPTTPLNYSITVNTPTGPSDPGHYCTPTTLYLNCLPFLSTLLTPTVLDRSPYFRTLLPCCPPITSRFIQYVPYTISKLQTFPTTQLFTPYVLQYFYSVLISSATCNFISFGG